MGDKSAIEWTDATWNPLRGCSRVSEGCRNCYAERLAARFSGPGKPYEGLAKIGRVIMTDGQKTHTTPFRWTGEVRFVEEALTLPLRWKKPRRIFVNSMSDLFHEKVPDEWIDRVFAVMALAPQHTFQILTKRPERMRTYMLTPLRKRQIAETVMGLYGFRARIKLDDFSAAFKGDGDVPNVWLGVSVEDRETYKQRVLYLANTPAVVRFVSFEPLLKDPGDLMLDGIFGGAYQWAIVGGESGPGARPFDLAWARSVISQCRAADVPVFVKQLGSKPRGWCAWPHHDERPPKWLDQDGVRPDVSGMPAEDLCHAVEEYFWPCAPKLRDRKGGAPAEWPRKDLRVQEFPR